MSGVATATTNQATETTAETPAADTAIDLTDDSAFDALTAALDSIVAPEDAPAETAEAVAEEKKESAKETPKEADLFSDAALAKLEGIKAARAKLLEERASYEQARRRFDKADIKQKKRETEWNEKKQTEEQTMANDRATARWLHAQLGVLKTGSAVQILDALGTLTGRPGRKVWEDLTGAALRDGKEMPVDPRVDDLREQNRLLQERLDKLEQRGGDEKVQRQQAFVERRKSEIAEAAADAETYPNLATYAAIGRGKEIVNYVVQLKREAKELGETLDDAAALARIDSEIAKVKGGNSGPAAGAKPQSTGKAPAQKPGGQSSRSTQTTSIAPSVARSNPTVREMTEDERDAELRRDADYVLSLFGG